MAAGKNVKRGLAVGGKRVFAARVSLPAVTMPERFYLRSSLAEMADEIRDGLSEAVVKQWITGMRPKALRAIGKWK